jgi:DNA-binding NarL/FixJ family response regulator
MAKIEKARVVVFEDNPHLRDSMSFLVNMSERYDCVCTFADTRDIVKKLERYEPELVIMDIEMPGMNGIDSTRLLKQHFPEIKVLVYTVFDDDERIFQSLCAGGSGYLLKSSTPEQVLRALDDIYSGGAALSPAVAERMVRFFQSSVSYTPADYSLTAKEKETLQQMVDGKSYKMIAEVLEVSVETIKYHVKNIYKKLHVNSSAEAVAKAIRQNIV